MYVVHTAWTKDFIQDVALSYLPVGILLAADVYVASDFWYVYHFWKVTLLLLLYKHVCQQLFCSFVSDICVLTLCVWVNVWLVVGVGVDIREGVYICVLVRAWASCQIRKIADAHAPGMPGTFSPSPQVSDPGMHHGTCVTHVPWCMPGSLTSGSLRNRRRGKTFPAFPAHAQPAILRIW